MSAPSAERATVGTDVVALGDGPVDGRGLGGKGAALARLVEWGLPVPPTAVVTTDAYRRFVDQPGPAEVLARRRGGAPVSAEEVDAAFRRGSFEPDAAALIVEVARRVGAGRPLAVRSSATVEDLAHSSFAGQYRSVLDVDPADGAAVLDAVRAVFASLWHPAPCAYRAGFGIDDEQAAMAVVLMQMVPAERAGVVFTVDPAGDEGSARIESVAGLGESLVSGRTTPSAVVLPRDGSCRDGGPGVDSALELALRIEARAGMPQDVEWAWDGSQVWIVQARPITVTGARDGDGLDDPVDELDRLDLTTAGIGEMLPGVLPPLVWGVSSFLVEEAFRHLLDDLAVLPPDLVEPRAVVRRVRGRAAMDFGRVQAMAGALPGSAAEDLEQEYFGSRRPGRPASSTPRGPARRLRAAAHDLRVLRSRGRYALDADVLRLVAEEMVAERPDLTTLDDRSLLARHLRLVDLAARGTAAELGVAADAAATFRRLQLLLSRFLGPVEGGRVADRVVVGLAAGAPLDSGSSAAVFAGPTWDELGRTPPVRPRPPSTDELELLLEKRMAEARRTLAASAGWRDDSVGAAMRMRAARRLAGEASARLRLREQAKAALLAIGGEVRRIHLEAGARLAARGVLDDPGDVDLLTPAELRSSLADGHAPPPDVLALRRRWQERYAQDGPLPPRFHGRPDHGPVAAAVGRRIEGWAASPGRHRGRAVVVRTPDDELPPGAVLVAEATDPSWSPVFLVAGALVLDRGGPLSHAAILARELGLPAVLNVPGATELLAGHDVTVDGDAGVVLVHDLDVDGVGDEDEDGVEDEEVAT